MKKYLFILLFLVTKSTFGQDLKLARKVIDTLTSPEMWGRGYTRDGMGKAANYISATFASYGLIPMDGKDFKQAFTYPANTFPGEMKLVLNGKPLVPGKDFLLSPESMGQQMEGGLTQKDSVTFINPEHRLLLLLKDKLTWSAAPTVADYTVIEVDHKAISDTPENIEINLENKFIPAFPAANICAMVKGTRNPDSILLITAHYDHLGSLGKDSYFPGANDNASGIALLLNLAKYYAMHPQPYTMAFICFAGEEIGLLGSKYFTEHPLIELNKIRFLINVDMVGTGENGITVVNATLHPKEFAIFQQINQEKQYLPKINSRGKAANSDHFFFTEKGVPAFFIYTQGGTAAYHDLNDQPKTLPLTSFENLFRLFVDFNTDLMK
ncbi:M28 family metallopeptidase [Pedobacter gandavensis]|uniref:M28 family peptidase n=1 Tax=Pedobacter gandavensis TaxID=2679963 RepID=A0ABR6EZK6_9SPHI|nr:M28 family peptidase [Pedobacter gandavensis]MBB2150254.1 M28 family peptidase [Pedobacter gandavensis]